MKTYTVEATWQTTGRMNVWAEDEDEARRIAQHLFETGTGVLSDFVETDNLTIQNAWSIDGEHDRDAEAKENTEEYKSTAGE